MVQKISQWFRTHEYASIFILCLLFVLIRLPGTNLPLHQDEYKWPLIVNPAHVSETEIPHPPLSQFIYRVAGSIVGFNVHFRFVPLFFGTLNLLLLYYFMRCAYGRKEAVISALIWTLSYFSVLASLMVDTDGEIMPFFFLIVLIGFYKLQEAYRVGSSGDRVKWWAVFIVGLIGGFFIKVSFLLVLCAVVAEFLWIRRSRIHAREVFRYAVFACVGAGVLGLLLFFAHYIFPFFDLQKALVYWEHFWVSDRNWFQTAIQCVKAIFYTSPFLFLIPFLATRETISKTRVFFFFLFGALFFYVILFDFSLGALDRYMQFLILPLSVIGGVTIATTLKHTGRRYMEFVLLGVAVGLGLLLLQFLPHYVPPLHPKSEWIDRVVHLKWNFLYPFSGGSGPLGFYVSFLYIVGSWIVSVISLIYFLTRTYNARAYALAFLITLGVLYNVTFIYEYVLGGMNGSAPKLLMHTIEYIANNPDIQKVTTYNDNGGNELQEIGKYRKRLYVDPKFDINDKIKTLNTYKEHYFVLNIPRLDPRSIYQKYFNSCRIIYTQTDHAISATVYDCRAIPDIHL